MTPLRRPPEWRDLPATSRTIMLRLLRHGPASRSELAAALGVSAATLTRAVVPLLALGMVREDAPVSAGPTGRPAIPLQAVASVGALFGVSITHDEVVVTLTDLRAEPIAHRRRAVCLERGDDGMPRANVDRVVADIAAMVEELGADHESQTERGAVRALALGVAIGGNVADGHTVRAAPFLGWEQVPLAERLEAATGVPVRLQNDLAALAEAELWFGAGLEVDRFIVVTVGIGVGYALVVDRHVITDESFGYGTITGSIMGEGWPDFSRPGELRGVRGDDAARRLGRLIATAAAFTMPQRVLVAGESAHVLTGHEHALRLGVCDVRHPLASDLDVRVHETDFGFWARGAATAALSWVAGVANPGMGE